MSVKLPIAVSLMLSIFCVTAFADTENKAWHANAEQSNLSFISVKKDAIAEVHQFERFTVTVDEKQQLNVEIDLNSVQTGVEIRDQRMREFLFDIVQFPTANLTADLSKLDTTCLSMDVPTKKTVTGWLNLHGVNRKLDMEVTAVKLNDNQIMITTAKPVIINANDFELSAGVTKLADLVGGIDIATAVPVTFQVLLTSK